MTTEQLNAAGARHETATSPQPTRLTESDAVPVSITPVTRHPQPSSLPASRCGRSGVLSAVLGALLTTACLSNVALKEKHANFHHCDSGDVSVEDLPSDGYAKYRTEGCGHEETFYCIVAKCRSGRILSIRHHAAKYNCKMEEISTEEPSPMLFATTGCGHTDRYYCKEAKNEVLSCQLQK